MLFCRPMWLQFSGHLLVSVPMGFRDGFVLCCHFASRRVQRVSCCLCLLYTTMLTSAMWYDRIPESGNIFSLGPFALTPEQVQINHCFERFAFASEEQSLDLYTPNFLQISIGVMSNLIVFPINLLIMTLFRKSRARRKRPSRVEKALK